MNEVVNYSYIDPQGEYVGLTCDESGLIAIRERSFFSDPHLIHQNDVAIGVIGDTHGNLMNAIYHLNDWVELTRKPIDLIIQTGDLTDKSVNSSPSSSKYVGSEHTLGLRDFGHAASKWDVLNRDVPNLVGKPIYFISGNHDVNDLEDMFYTSAHPFTLGRDIVYLENGEIAYWNDSVDISREVCMGALGWNHTKADVRVIQESKPDILISHSDLPFEAMRDDFATFSFFGHHKDAIARSRPLKNIFGLDHVAKVGTAYRPGSSGVLYFRPKEKMGRFIYLPKNLINATNSTKISLY